ncbi:gluzincin family metallopeptidase [Photorhabdus antumapuensis]|uniref:M3 family metallopeptidase n=1 Tax=Photorhabdus antumapuensis TaxID=2862867 RepID=UPI001CED51B0|nr:M3 family metallopeptidase [Photorhabdus antumapuensis]MCA6222709.1 hypothetical protein [Photorhabdus antumapuensis]
MQNINSIHSEMAILHDKYILEQISHNNFFLTFSQLEKKLADCVIHTPNWEGFAKDIYIGHGIYNGNINVFNEIKNLKNIIRFLNDKLLSDISGMNFISTDKHHLKSFFSDCNNIDNLHIAYKVKHSINDVNKEVLNKIFYLIDKMVGARNYFVQRLGYKDFASYKCNYLFNKDPENVKNTLEIYYHKLINSLKALCDHFGIDVKQFTDPATFRMYQKNLVNRLSLSCFNFHLSEILGLIFTYFNKHSQAHFSIEHESMNRYVIRVSTHNDRSFCFVIQACQIQGTVTAISCDEIFDSSVSTTYLKSALFHQPLGIAEIKTVVHEIGHLISIGMSSINGGLYHSDFRATIEIPSQLSEHIFLNELVCNTAMNESQKMVFDNFICMDVLDEMRQIEFAFIDLYLHSGVAISDLTPEKLINGSPCFFNYPTIQTKPVYLEHIISGGREGAYSLYPLNNIVAHSLSATIPPTCILDYYTNAEMLNNVIHSMIV